MSSSRTTARKPRRTKSGDSGVTWHLPKSDGTYAARPFFRTPPSTLHLIELLAEDGATWADLAGGINFDPDAVAVARGFVDAGHGDVPVREHLTPVSWP